ncbi:transporter substrate-binding domain-containing protein [Microbulbifer pacificus]|uniref:transporter substrate-binding domain-containing protein n=1 Tax=Microbulbifer pacificus TaxID=407164 RepID=UPI001319CB7F|nr:transporter substrate-binding domain-containing protein [Microbulbifer pacificus]
MIVTLAGCGGNPEDLSAQKAAEGHNSAYVETGDLAALKKRGTIRFVSVSVLEENVLEQFRRSEIVTQRHYERAMEFARRLKLKPVWMRAQTDQEIIEMLQSGKADIAVDSAIVTEERREQVNFTIPLEKIHQLLVTGRHGPDISNVENLRNVTLMVIKGTVLVDTAKEIIKAHPDANLTLQEIPFSEGVDQFIDQVNRERNAVTIMPSNIAKGVTEYRSDVRLGAQVSDLQSIAWAYRHNSPELGQRLDNFLTSTLVNPIEKRIADWKQIKESGVIRLLTYNGPTGYFLWKGVLMGWDYDLAVAFAEKHKLQLQVVVVPFEHSLVEWLKEGRGDFAGSFSTLTPERKAQGVAFSTPFAEMAEQILSNRKEPPITNLEDLKGRTLILRAFSPFSASAHALEKAGLGVNVELAPPQDSYMCLINKVAEGELDATIMDAHTAQIEASLRPDLIAGMMTSDPKPKGWMVLPENQKLLQEINTFIRDYRKSEAYSELVKHYLEPKSRYLPRMQARIVPGADISPYDDLVKASAAEYRFDWRMVVAQMWQESSFNPNAVSPAGAQGLMQVMPRTAEDMGFDPPLFDPERGIQAGVKYLRWVHDRFPESLDEDEKLWFTLASYNAGYGHLLDARQLAEKLGLDPDQWFDNVEVAMLKLSEPRYFEKARYGFVHGAEPVAYVRNISNLYKAYAEVASGDISRAEGSPSIEAIFIAIPD